MSYKKLKTLSKSVSVLITATIFTIILIIFTSSIITSILDITFIEFFDSSNLSKPSVLATLTVSQGLAFILTYIFYTKLIEKVEESLNINYDAIINILTGFVLTIIMYSIFLIITTFLNIEPESNQLIELTKSNLNINIIIVLLFSISIIAPITEEIIFRGLIQEYLLDSYNYITAIIITSILFTILHINGLFLIFIISIILGYYKYKTENILVPIGIHFLYNTTLIIIFLIINL
jgi:membrane protease YdiL (CAAX protease family)